MDYDGKRVGLTPPLERSYPAFDGRYNQSHRYPRGVPYSSPVDPETARAAFEGRRCDSWTRDPTYKHGKPIRKKLKD